MPSLFPKPSPICLEVKVKTLLLKMKNHSVRRVDVPNNATFTVGPMLRGQYQGHDGWAVRVKVGNKQVGVFSGVAEAWYSDSLEVYNAMIQVGADAKLIGKDLFDEISIASGLAQVLPELPEENDDLGF